MDIGNTSNARVEIMENNGIFSTVLHNFPEKGKSSEIIKTNLRSIANFVKECLESNLQDYEEIEEMIGNMGNFIMMGHISQIVSFVFYVLSYKKIKDIFFSLGKDINAISETDEKPVEMFIDTKEKHSSSEKRMVFLNLLYASITTTLFKDVLSEEDFDLDTALELFLSDDLVKALNDSLDDAMFDEKFKHFLKENIGSKKNFH